MFIDRANAVTDELVEAFERLIPQLKLSISLPSRQEIETLLASNASILLTARYPSSGSPIAGRVSRANWDPCAHRRCSCGWGGARKWDWRGACTPCFEYSARGWG